MKIKTQNDSSTMGLPQKIHLNDLKKNQCFIELQ